MAHSDFPTLKILLQTIDDERNDIYLHIDKKARDVDLNIISTWVKKSGLYFTKRLNIYWGHHSIVKCELNMLAQATANDRYSYYHLLSGVDFPLKSQDYIHNFFEGKDLEYVTYFHNDEKGREFDCKIRYYYLFMKYLGRANIEGKGIKKKALRHLNWRNQLLMEWQKNNQIDRRKHYQNIEFVKGDQWFSITDNLARYLLSEKHLIMKMSRFMDGPDEIFVQTIAYNSHFRDKIAGESIREIDWERGSPYQFGYQDLEQLKTSDKLFVRKVSYTADNHEPKLIDGLLENIK